jgi:3-hydroxybutyryl-CoA dehydratase
VLTRRDFADIQNLKFIAPVRTGDTITAEIEVLEKNETTRRLKLKTTCRKSDGTPVLVGESTCLIPKPVSA